MTARADPSPRTSHSEGKNRQASKEAVLRFTRSRSEVGKRAILAPAVGDRPLPDRGVLVHEINDSRNDNIGPIGHLRYAFRPRQLSVGSRAAARRTNLFADCASPGHILLLDHTAPVGRRCSGNWYCAASPSLKLLVRDEVDGEPERPRRDQR